MTFELAMLLASVILLFVYIGVQSGLMTKDMGSDYNAGPRDETLNLGVKAGRADRALSNFLETYPAFIGLALATAVMAGSNWLTQGGAALYVLGRVVYIPLYLYGIKYVRSLAFLAASVGLLLMVVGLVL